MKIMDKVDSDVVLKIVMMICDANTHLLAALDQAEGNSLDEIGQRHVVHCIREASNFLDQARNLVAHDLVDSPFETMLLLEID
jgi:hypothetical protein